MCVWTQVFYIDGGATITTPQPAHPKAVGRGEEQIETATMACLPHDVIVNILQYLDKVDDFISCEKTCKAFQHAALDDDSWSSLSLGFPIDRQLDGIKWWRRRRTHEVIPQADRMRLQRIFGSLRDIHRYNQALRYAQKYQAEHNGQHIVQVLGINGWKLLVESGIHDETAHCCKLDLRGDASYCLAEVLEANIVRQLRNTWKIAQHRQDHLTTVETRDFDLQVELSSADADVLLNDSDPFYEGLGSGVGIRVGSYENAKSRVAGLFNEDIRYRLVRRLAYVAGIVKIENCVHEVVWDALLKILYDVTSHVLIRSTSGIVPCVNDYDYIVRGKKRKLEKIGDVRNIPPFPRLISDQLVFTIVPGQIEDAFKHANCSTQKCWGNPWTQCSPLGSFVGEGVSFWHASNSNIDVGNEMEESLKFYSIRKDWVESLRTHIFDDDSSSSSSSDDERTSASCCSDEESSSNSASSNNFDDDSTETGIQSRSMDYQL